MSCPDPPPSCPPRPLSWLVRIVFLYAGVVLPIVCHAMTAVEPPDAPSWQSGSLEDKLAFTLSGPAGILFYPLMLYAAVSLTLLMIREHRFAGHAAVRFGIYSGIPVAAWYSLMLGVVEASVSGWRIAEWMNVLMIAAFAVLPPLAVWGLVRLAIWFHRKFRLRIAVYVAVGIALYLVGILFMLIDGADPVALVTWPLTLPLAGILLSLIFAPYWALAVYTAMACRLLWLYPRPLRFPLLQLLGAVSWLAAFLAACRWAVVRSLEEYARLPVTSPGDCYVASAAAYGHPRWVRSQSLATSAGDEMRVNRQLRVLKSGELAMKVLVPTVHRVLRRGYAWLGPQAAGWLSNPFAADAVYLALKPVEWATLAALVCLLGPECRRVEKLYLGQLPRSGER